MLQLDTLNYCFWRNAYAPIPVLVGTVSLGDAFQWTTQRLSPAAVAVFNEQLPDVLARSGSIDAAALIARVAQHVQLLADVTAPSCGVVSRNDVTQSAILFFSCLDSFLAPRCLSLAVQVVDRLTQSEVGAERLARMLKSCTDMVDAHGLERRTRDMIKAATRRGIPWLRFSPLVRHVQLGQGVRQERFWNTMFGSENAFGRDYSRNKVLTLSMLDHVGLPVGRVEPVRDVETALRAAEAIGYPLVLKPVDGTQGDSVYVDLHNEAELRAALAAAGIHERHYLLQSFFPGDDHRLLVVAGKLVAAARRIPASVVGDGRHTVAELVRIENLDPRRVNRLPLAPIELDQESDRLLARQGYTRASILDAGRFIRVRATANISTGGTSVNAMDTIHPDNVQVAVRAARTIGLKIAGVDFISPDISRSWREVGGGICEVNASVGLRPHYLATPDLDVWGKLVEGYYPEGEDGRIPTAMITGTFGKTTTTLMLASILSSAGHTVGSATTESVRIGSEDVARGDYAGVNGASIVMNDASVTAAVLETARGGLVKAGIYLDYCDVAALLNVAREQIDMDGIETLDDMAALKRKVLDGARKAVVLNADDARCLALVPEFAGSVRTLLFSRAAGSPALRDHMIRGGDAVFLADCEGHETITAANGSNIVRLLRTADVPVTHHGLFWQHASNAMAAAALAIGLGIDLDTIRKGLERYGKEFRPASCRLAVDDEFPTRIVFDYAASPPGFAAAIRVTDTVPVSGRRFCAATVAGNRPDWIFADSSAALAGHFQRYVFFELDEYRRGRRVGEIAARMSEALIATGVDPSLVSVVASHREVAEIVAREAGPDDFVIVFGMDSPAVIEQYRGAFRRAGKGRPGPPSST